MIRARIKGSPLKMCYYPWFKNFNKHLASSKVTAWTGPNRGHRGAVLLEHFTNTWRVWCCTNRWGRSAFTAPSSLPRAPARLPSRHFGAFNQTLGVCGRMHALCLNCSGGWLSLQIRKRCGAHGLSTVSTAGCCSSIPVA
jgi:hypothetical protein